MKHENTSILDRHRRRSHLPHRESRDRCVGGLSFVVLRAFKSACGEVQPSEGRLQASFESHFGKLSKSCGDKLSHAAAVAKACAPDARKFCGDVTRGAAIPACMKRRLAEVDEPCKVALAKAGVRAARKR